jgi:hypothetical protein
MITDTYEIYDHLADRETLIVYMTKHEGQSITIDGNLLTTGRCTRILQDSYDFRPVHKRQVKIGERLTVSATVGGGLKARTIPTDWVVTEAETYEPKSDIPGFREIIIAYCEQIPLSLDEFRKAIYDSGVVVTLDSFGGDEEAYQKYLQSSKATVNINGNFNTQAPSS